MTGRRTTIPELQCEAGVWDGLGSHRCPNRAIVGTDGKLRGDMRGFAASVERMELCGTHLRAVSNYGWVQKYRPWKWL